MNVRFALILGLAGFVSLPAQEDLSQKVERLEQELKILKRQLELDKEVSAEKSKSAAVASIGANGFQIRSDNTNFVMKIRGYTQADGRFYLDDENRVAPNDTFLIRRVRPIIEGTIFEKFEYRVMLDFGSGASTTVANNGLLQDAYFTARLAPWFQLVGGKMKEPISQERLQSGANLLFVERPYTVQLAPNRDVGFMIQGDVVEKRLSYALGVFNGVASGASGDVESADDEKDVVGRLMFEPFRESKLNALRGLGFGIAGSYGNQKGGLRGYSSAGQQSMFSWAGTVADGEHWRIAPQGYYYVGPFGLFGEYVVSNQRVRQTNTFDRFQITAWTVSASYFLTGETNSFKTVEPLRPFNFGKGGWGAWELAARLQQFDVDNDIFTAGFATGASSATSATTWGGGINWHLNRNFKVNLNYEQTDFQGGSTPFLLEGEKVVFTRAQFSF